MEPLGTEALIAETETDDDFAAVALDARGHRHVAWISYDADAKEDRLLVRDVDDPAHKPQPIAVAREFTSVRLLRDRKSLRALWCSPGEQKNWDVYTAVRTDGGWKTERLSAAEGTDFHLTADRGADGTVWIAWQTFRSGNGDVYAKCLRGGRWSEDIAVATTQANEWEPAVSVDKAGAAWIAYDSYEHGNYDVYLVPVRLQGAPGAGASGSVGERIAVARSSDFEAHASVLAAGDGKVWVAYDAAGPNWGKDFKNVPTTSRGHYTEPLHAQRRLELRCVVDGKVHRPRGALPQELPPEKIPAIQRSPHTKPSRFYEYPQLALDGDGRLWLFFRLCRQGYCPHPPKGLDWNIYATSYTEDGWLNPIQLPLSQGRQNQRVSFAVGADQNLVCAWADGNRFASVDHKYSVHHGALPAVAEAPAAIPLEAMELEPPGDAEPREDITHTVRRRGNEYRVYFGDLHRHTNISRCAPTIDGSLTDAHRYALDAVRYDFLGITDHTRDVDPFSWWRTQKACDLFHIPGRYVPIYAYERSNDTPGGGHRNVFFLNRGNDVNPSDHWYLGRGLERPDTNPDTTLYPWLKETGGALTAAHTPAWSKAAMRGTWTYNDPQVEPVAEIYQAFRTSYERPGGGVTEEASLWHALRKGYRLGFVASSDHIATHTSYACVWATGKTREAIFEALQARRTYGATDRIVLDVRIGESLMGEETHAAGETVTLSIRALGTAPIEELQIVRSGEVIARLTPGGRDVSLEYSDDAPRPGNSFYYVRLAQEDGNLAWGSPIWVTR